MKNELEFAVKNQEKAFEKYFKKFKLNETVH